MKIAHIVRRFSRAEWGGTETVVEHVVREQAARGHDVRVFCTSALQPEGKAAAGAGVPCAAFAYFYPYFPMPAPDRLTLDKKGGNPFAFGLFRAVRAWRPDVLHIHAMGRLAAASVKLAERLGVPSLVSLHGGAAVVPKAEIEQMLRPLRHKFPYGGILDRLLGLRFDPLARTDAVLAISKAEVRRLRERYPARRVAYFPNGITPAAEAAPRAPNARAFRKLLCVSRIDYQKNQLALVDLLAARPECTLTLVGPVTSAWYADRIRARVSELNLENRFALIPGLPPDSPELAAQYAAADVFVLPSRHEPFGIVALEAMRAGVPLVAANVGGLPDFVRDGENGLLFAPDQPGALVQAYARLTPALADRLVAGGQATVKGYNWTTLVGQLLDLYADLRKERAGG